MPYANHREQLQAQAKERQEAASKRTPEEQLARLDELLGKGQGAKKERAKLQARIEKAKKEAQEEVARKQAEEMRKLAKKAKKS